MKTIEITVKDKIATAADDVVYICGNSDYVVDFHFDGEWDAYDTKTARFICDGTYQDQVFRGKSCPVPIIYSEHFFRVGVFAGNLHTTTMACIKTRNSALSEHGVPADPAPDVYAQIMELIQGLGEPDPETIAAAVAEYIRNNPIEETDPTVPAWAKAAEKPAYTAAEVGAISQEDLQAATDAALSQAKERGLFDGEPGKDGVDGKDGQPGADGSDGKDGADGHTPVKGTDYFTEADKQEIASAAAEIVSIPDALPNPNALTFTGAATGTYDGSAPLSVEIPSGSGGGSGGSGSMQETVLASGVVASGTAQWHKENTGLTVADLQEWKLWGFVCVASSQSMPFGITFGNTTIFTIPSKGCKAILSWFDDDHNAINVVDLMSQDGFVAVDKNFFSSGVGARQTGNICGLQGGYIPYAKNASDTVFVYTGDKLTEDVAFKIVGLIK